MLDAGLAGPQRSWQMGKNYLAAWVGLLVAAGLACGQNLILIRDVQPGTPAEQSPPADKSDTPNRAKEPREPREPKEPKEKMGLAPIFRIDETDACRPRF